MHRSVELELEEVDRFHDEQLLRKANVSPFFTSAHAPFGMSHELDFSPQAIPCVVDEISASATPTDSPSTTTALSLDYSPPPSCSLSDAGGELGTTLTPLPQVSSWQVFDSESFDDLHKWQSADASHVGECRCTLSDSKPCPALLECHERDALRSQSDTRAELAFQSDACSCHSLERGSTYVKDRRSQLEHAVKHDLEFRDDGCQALASLGHGDDQHLDYLDARRTLYTVNVDMFKPATDRCEHTASTSEHKARLFLSTGASSTRASSSARSRVEPCGRRVHRAASSGQLTRPLQSQRVMREKMLPHHQQQHQQYYQQQNTVHEPETNRFRAHKLIAVATASNSMFKMIPFPTESLGATSTESSRVTRKRYSDVKDNHHHHQQQQQQDRTWKKYAPLPDVNRTAKSKRAIRSANLFTHEWSTPVLTKIPTRGKIDSSFLSPVTPFTSNQQHGRFVDIELLQPRPHVAHNIGATAFAAPLDLQMRRSSNEKSTYCGGYFVLLTTLRVPTAVSQQQQQSPQLHERRIGAYSPTARRERIRRYHEKRKQLVFHKRIKYACRKRLAIACPRIKGRFVRKQDLLDAQTPSDNVCTC